VRLIQNRCAHLGDEETVVISGETTSYDWRSMETVYQITANHTHLDRAKVSQEKARATVANRFKFLSRKMLNDIASGEKIFAYKVGGEVLPLAVAQEIAASFAEVGPAPVVLVCEGEHESLPFDVTEISPHCILVRRDVHHESDPLYGEKLTESWVAICKYALDHFRTRLAID